MRFQQLNVMNILCRDKKKIAKKQHEKKKRKINFDSNEIDSSDYNFAFLKIKDEFIFALIDH